MFICLIVIQFVYNLNTICNHVVACAVTAVEIEISKNILKSRESSLVSIMSEREHQNVLVSSFRDSEGNLQQFTPNRFLLLFCFNMTHLLVSGVYNSSLIPLSHLFASGKVGEGSSLIPI